MSWSRWGVVLGTIMLLTLGPKRPEAAEEAPPPAPRAFKSVYGTLQSIDKSLNGLIMKSDKGERLAWRFEAAVIAEAARFKPGDPMIVIYRQLSPTEKAVTAVAFPGTAATPIYVNMTGRAVLLRSAPAVGGACGKADAGPVNDFTIGNGSLTEIMDACWCCAPIGETCVPGNKSGSGRALLVACFK
jgi:hypothetical protein